MNSCKQNNTLLQPGELIRPHVTAAIAGELCTQLYGLKETEIKELNGYDDKNFYVKADSISDNPHLSHLWPHGYVLKILNCKDSKNQTLIDAQNKLMQFLHNQGININVPVPNIHGEVTATEQIATADGKDYTHNIVRLLTFIPGETLISTGSTTAALCYQVGQLSALIDDALKNFHHPAYDSHQSIWMLSNAPKVLDFSFAITDASRKALVHTILKEFEDEVLTRTDKLPKGMIHGDINEQNLIVCPSDKCPTEYKIHGILDVGDSQYNCYVFELALATMYQMLMADDATFLERGGHVIAGYISLHFSLSDLEWDLLKICIEARYCQSLVMGAYTNYQEPSNVYVLSTAAKGWNQLLAIRNTSKEELYQLWRSIIQQHK